MRAASRPVKGTPLLPAEQWREQLGAALGQAARPSTIAATVLRLAEETMDAETEAGLSERPRDQDLPPYLKGRYGSAVGRAVHGILQTIEPPARAWKPR